MRRLDGLHGYQRPQIIFETVRDHPLASGLAVLLAVMAFLSIAWVNFYALPIFPQTPPELNSIAPTVSVNQTPEAKIPAEPVRIRINSIGVDAPVTAVGLTKKGAMAVPKKTDQVGWYQPGRQPGQSGSAVMTGHLDDIWLRPAVFAQLGSLKPNDEVVVLDQSGQSWRFLVTDVSTYDVKSVPLDRIFASSAEPRLNLITCSGAWSWRIASYKQRVVVSTTLAPE